VKQHSAEEAPLFSIEAIQTKFWPFDSSIISNYIIDVIDIIGNA